MMIEEAGATTETAKSLGIGASTLRKYAAALEEQGYRFERSANKSRLFKSDDIECIERLMTELREHNLPLADAVVTVLAPEAPVAAVHVDVPVVGIEGLSETECAATVMSSVFPEEPELTGNLRSYEGLGQLVSEVTYGAVEQQQDDRVQLLQQRVDELELTLQHLAETHMALQEQMEKQRLWMNEKLEEERDRELVTNLRSFQGRKRKPKGVSLRMLFGLLPKKHKEA
ncbi:hypothetical protein QVE09_26595 [Paenibacillus sp. ClWae2A]|uniref:hypothetical protein n=1 Tax=Paenibacillus sp. ClWae2A TaxID=3057177 RepID=UPI0028F510B6|nr:hypothetical protein [Paenibacillus sp. ClWae2A]MDT9722476.1 hypothetical protein [Paenibacillus sp. ClWae2A]